MLGQKRFSGDSYRFGNKRTNLQRLGHKFVNLSSSKIHNNIQIEGEKPFQSPLEKTHTQHKMWHN